MENIEENVEGTYKCSLCGYLTGSREKAYDHGRILADDLPKGLVIKRKGWGRGEKCRNTVIYNTTFSKDHRATSSWLFPDPDSEMNPFDRGNKPCEEGKGIVVHEPARFIRNGLNEIWDSFLTPNEFDEFVENHPKTLEALKNYCGIEEYVRTDPKIEAFVNDLRAGRKLKDLTESSLENYAPIKKDGLIILPDLGSITKDASLVEVYRHAPKNSEVAAFNIGNAYRGNAYRPSRHMPGRLHLPEDMRYENFSLWPVQYYEKNSGAKVR